jgi:glutathione S-transferase
LVTIPPEKPVNGWKHSMALAVYYHPLASFCHKVLIALYENATPFAPHIVDLADQDASAGFLRLWPVGKIPVLHDEVPNRIIPETTIIIEYLDRHYRGQQAFFPEDEAQNLDARLWDRFFDFYLQLPMQKIVTDRLRPAGKGDRRGVADAKESLAMAYRMIEERMADRPWAAGETFSIADCAAAPALFYAGIVAPFPVTHGNLAAYFERLLARPSFRRVIAEAQPYFELFPFKNSIPQRFFALDERTSR